MSQGLAQFTPQQLLEAGRRAEADGRPDLAHQFYRYLSENYGYTAEAADGRAGLSRVTAGEAPPIWQLNSHAPPPTGQLPPMPSVVRPAARRVHARRAEPHEHYRSGRALAALATGAGWLTIGVAVALAAAGAAAYLAPIPQLQELKLTTDMLLLLLGAVPGGAAMVLAGQVARALFDQAAAMRELAAIERAKRLPD